ncbi:TRAP transporter small permease subunit [Frigidibacter albus]|uniref:TRAP transporter small permease protein n=1 Tax=Frigidibacter albus TaxID=1465486 RepID=A0A6L8VE53_9RHOB|nr:TRAP transporter small permease [Frigidibacter albus]MZQ87510.1 TRAP transporter small permease subunit [Frigidibacter albus]NBE29416.1 TRAP transporter small permease subunit [Frigidibacter albus]GGH45057.1 C4-dicarboxylate ABC transporter permease [Frigidibacter albus]
MNSLLTVRLAYGQLLTYCGWFAGAATFAMMTIVVANVVARYAFNSSVPGAMELTEGALPLIIFLSLALTQFHGGHIRVSMLTDRLPRTLSQALLVLALLAGAVLFGWAAWAGWLSAEKSLAIGEMKRGSIRYPVWPIKFAVSFGMALLTVQFLIDALCVAVGMPLQDADPEEVE